MGSSNRSGGPTVRLPGKGDLLGLAHEVLGLFAFDGALHALSPRWGRLDGLARLQDLTDAACRDRIDEGLRQARANGDADVTAPFRGGAITYRWHLQAIDDDALVVALSPVDPEPAAAHAALSGAAAGIALIDREGHLYYVNAALAAIYGHTREDLIGRAFTVLLREDDHERAWAHHHATIASGEATDHIEYDIVRADGERRIVQAHTARAILPEGIFRLSTVVDITDIRVNERRLREAEARYRHLFENSSEGIYWSTPEGRLIQVNGPLVRMHRCRSKEELIAGVRNLAADWYTDAGDRARLTARLERDGRVENFEAEIRRCGTGETFWTSENASAIRDASGTVLYYQGTVRDITEERRRRELAAHRTEILEKIARDGDLTETLYDIVGAIEHYHPRVTAAICRLRDGLLRVQAAPGLANACIEAIHRRSPADIGGPIAAVVASGEAVMDAELPADAGEGGALAAVLRETVYSNVMALPVHNPSGAVLGVLAVFVAREADVTGDLPETLREIAQITSLAFERQGLTEQLRQQAQYDPLTGLPNRSLFDDRLSHLMLDAGRHDYPVAVMMLDLDEFKLVNDTLGHHLGDALLQRVAERLQRRLRASDTVARFGGDEFVIVAPLDSAGRATDVAERVLQELQPAIGLDGHQLHARPSIGISLFPQDGLTTEALIQAADTAMYAAKQAGKNHFRFFSESMNAEVTNRLRVEAELRDGLANGELVLHYQPVLACDGERIVGAEALLRWQHPTRGLLPPVEFLPIAELSDLIAEIDYYVLNAAAEQVAQWRAAGQELLMSLIVTSLNLSARGLHEEGFAVEVARILERAGIPPSSIELEITESMVMRDFEGAINQLRDLRARAPGIRIAIDDFGTGQSSFEYLRQLPVDTLKIDYSFIADIAKPETDRTAQAIVKTIVELGHNLELTVVAEGVEAPEQAEFLRAIGCHRLQGFLYSQPLEQSRFEEYVAGQ